MDRRWTAELLEQSLVEGFSSILVSGTTGTAGRNLDLKAGRRMSPEDVVVAVFKILHETAWELERSALVCWAKNKAGVANGGITIPIFMERRSIHSRQAFDKVRRRGAEQVATTLNGFRALTGGDSRERDRRYPPLTCCNPGSDQSGNDTLKV